MVVLRITAVAVLVVSTMQLQQQALFSDVSLAVLQAAQAAAALRLLVLVRLTPWVALVLQTLVAVAVAALQTQHKLLAAMVAQALR